MHKESAKMAEMSPREQAASMASGFQILVEDLSAQLADEKKKSATAAEEYKLQTETSTAKLAERDRKCLDLQCQIVRTCHAADSSSADIGSARISHSTRRTSKRCATKGRRRRLP